MRCEYRIGGFLGTSLVALGVVLAGAASAVAQGTPTGAIRGQVVDPSNLALPGVSVTVSSPALQGMRTAVTSTNGDFIIPFLPAGEYIAVFELQNFKTQTRKIGVAMAETQPIEIQMTLATITETVTVTGTAFTEVLKTGTVAETYKSEMLERLPIGRTLTDAVLLAPGVVPNGPQQSDGTRNIVMSGALSFENLFLVNGVTVNENLRGQPLLLYIEDAIQETKVSTAGISAEFGRFQGGVVNMITKSGGNAFSGSFRTSLTNDAWRALTPYPSDQVVSSVTPTYEATGGGPIRRDKVWFFGAWRYNDTQRNKTLDFTGLNYTFGQNDQRGEAKLTWALDSSNNVKASYTKRAVKTTNNNFGTVMDLASLYDNSNDFTLSVVNYTSVLKPNVFFEGQYSKKVAATMDTGSRFTDIAKGTPVWDRSRGQARFSSPTFCAVCGTGWLEHRDNWDWFLKLTYFLSTASTGSHNLVAGFDNFKEMRQNNNWQSGSQFRVQATSAILDGGNIYPVFNTGTSTYIEYLPLVAESVGNDIRTYSGFVNDAWQFSKHLSFNLGLRYDRNRSKDQTGLPVVSDSKWSPRVGVIWDPKGEGNWTVNAGYARYVTEVSTALVDAGSAGGRTATYSYFYQGPAINTGAGPYLTAEQALPLVFAWFNANGGLTRTTRNAPSIPGVTTAVSDGTVAPNSNAYTVGVANDIARGRGTWRLDYEYRDFQDIYGDFRDTTTGRVTDPTGRTYDLVIVKNTSDAVRTYKGLTANLGYRVGPTQIGANYTLSWARGNVAGEDAGSGPIRASLNDFPEYRQPRWNTPVGYVLNDQRHKVRAWVAYILPAAPSLGQLNVGVVQRFDSALPYDASGSIDSRPYVTNPGYVTPPSTVTYYFSDRFGLRFDNIWTTDVSFNWSKRLPNLRTAEVFFRGVVSNVFNNSEAVGGDSTVLTAASPGTVTGLQAFNPFTTTPVEGVNWVKSSVFGQPSGVGDYQPARTFSCSLGIRF
jgi:outer membrane receptor protein involved in Fe transport